MVSRRELFKVGLGAAGGLAALRVAPLASAEPEAAKGSKGFEIMKSDAEWQTALTPEQFRVLRKHGTEPAGSSPLDKVYKPGLYSCAGCSLPLYSSDTKFHSGTGWPSFWKPLDNAVETSTDTSYFMIRTEVHCRRCGGHLGHVFDDGPPPTGLRYCMNGVALKFEPKDGNAPT
jgi:peptide-methionine (R)-S-oxide reductase